MLSRLAILTVAVCVLSFPGFATASPPVPPPMEGFVIGTAVDINCIGDVIEDEEFTWTYIADTGPPGRPPDIPAGWVGPDDMYLGFLARAGQIRYDEGLRAIDSGAMQLNKVFSATSHDEPNIEVAKDYAWAGMEGSGITNVENRERMGLSIVANGDFEGLGDMPSLCPWVRNNFIPATNEFIAMGSRTTATGASGNMVSITRTDATSTGPPSLNHSISASGLGTAEAEMRLSLMEGNSIYDPEVDVHFVPMAVLPDGADGHVLPVNQAVPNIGQPPGWGEGPPNMVSLTEYEEYTGAFGQIPNFDKTMHYNSVIPALQMPEPWYSILP
jgi:hypothetical protein